MTTKSMTESPAKSPSTTFKFQIHLLALLTSLEIITYIEVDPSSHVSEGATGSNWEINDGIRKSNLPKAALCYSYLPQKSSRFFHIEINMNSSSFYLYVTFSPSISFFFFALELKNKIYLISFWEISHGLTVGGKLVHRYLPVC